MTHTNFLGSIRGSWEKQDLVIEPCFQFANWNHRGVYKERPSFYVRSGAVVGYRIPNYARLLQVSGDVATDYFARFVIHDIGHGILPEVPLEKELLHNAVMVKAMGAELVHHSDPWEGLVHAECTDPLFFLRARSYFEPALSRISQLNPTLRRFAVKLWGIYGNKGARALHRKVWGIPSKKRGLRAEHRASAVLSQMEHDGFRRYELA